MQTRMNDINVLEDSVKKKQKKLMQMENELQKEKIRFMREV